MATWNGLVDATAEAHRAQDKAAAIATAAIAESVAPEQRAKHETVVGKLLIAALPREANLDPQQKAIADQALATIQKMGQERDEQLRLER